jgi:hypothetical protein
MEDKLAVHVASLLDKIKNTVTYEASKVADLLLTSICFKYMTTHLWSNVIRV